MGGVGFLIASSVAFVIGCLYLLYNGEARAALSLLLCAAYAVLNGFIGMIDDYTKLRKKENAGLTPMQKLILGAALALLFLASRTLLLGEGTALYFSFGTVDLGILYYPLAAVALIGTVNCANLTDGIDGLAAGVAFAIGLSLFYISYSTSADVALISSALIGAMLGFLIFNINPARIFMGDTGSLFLGALVASCAQALGNILMLATVGVVYFIEGLSVIIRVLHFKRTGKRVFKMAPLHHHLEKCGWSENKIVLSAVFLTLLLSLASFALLV